MSEEYEESLAETLAFNHITQYMLRGVHQPPEGVSNPLTAALYCHCVRCLDEYFRRLDQLTRYPKWSDEIARSYGLSRNAPLNTPHGGSKMDRG